MARTRRPASSPATAPVGQDISFTVPAALQGGATRGAPGAPAQRLTARPGRDLVQLQIDGGPLLWLHPETARDLLLAQAGAPRTAGPAPREVAVDAQLHWQGLEAPAVGTRGATRGFLGRVALSAVRVVAGPLTDQLTGPAQDLAADRIVQRMDAQVVEDVYPLQPDQLGPLKGQAAARPTMAAAADGGPTLVFIHGTFSTTATGFGKLWLHHPQKVQTLFKRYAGRVYALDHATLGRSPIDNALTLARRCPPGARLHLVTHSRGGLVAEVLVRAAALAGGTQRDDAAAQLFRVDQLPKDFTDGLDLKAAQAALDEQRRTLDELVRELKTRQVSVERVLRVACPARGTLLASKRLDAYVSVFKWSLELAGVPVAPELLDFLGGVAQRRADPTRLPGLAAMIPDSPLIRWLHAAQAPAPGQLRVVAGDLQGDSVGSWLKTLAADAFYWTDSDLVVQTRSMYGGVPRAAEASFMLDAGGQVTHFNYFANERTAEAITTALLQDTPSGWRPIGPLSWAGESATGVRGAGGARSLRGLGNGASQPAKPAVFVLPGILGSHLAVDGRRIWLGWRLVNGLKKLALPDTGKQVRPDGALGLTYDDLIEFLGNTHEVVEFSYDWRLPLEQEARRLAQAVQAALDARQASGQPVRLLAHSMGGLLARTLQLERPQVWDRMMAHADARLLMLGTPNGGSWAPMQVLSGDDSFGNLLVAFGGPFQDQATRQLMAQFPGFIQLQAGLLDARQGLNRRATWVDLAARDLQQVRQLNWWHSDGRQLAAYEWGVPAQAVLDAAVALRKRLDAQRDTDLKRYAGKLALVVGHARFTPDGYELGEEGLAYLNAAEAGDGRVTLASAVLPGVPTWRLDCEHGNLPDDSRAFEAFHELLVQGRTQRLPALLADDSVRRGGAGAAGAAGTEAEALQAVLRAAVHVKSRPARQRNLPRPPLPPEQAPLPASAEAGAAWDPAAAANAAASTLAVSVVNGDLQFVRQPLMLGHYRASKLTGTERVMDGLIGGTMAQSLALGQYPDLPGTHQVFVNTGHANPNPLQLPRPPRVLVVGLGDEGNLRAGDLVATVRLGVLGLAQQLMQQPLLAGDAGNLAPRFDLASTLLGSGGATITAGQAAQAIAQGVHEADESLRLLNEQLQQAAEAKPHPVPPRLWPRVAQLVLIELYLTRAGEAWRALQSQAEAQPGHYRVAPTLHSLAGALRRPLGDGYRGSDNDYVRALGTRDRQGQAVIEFTADSRKRARTEREEKPVQVRLLRELVARASSDANRDPQIGRTLFNLLVPPELGPLLGGSAELLLQVDRATAGIPWELLDTDPRGDAGSRLDDAAKPWALRSKLIRTLATSDYRRQVADAQPDAQVLVIGEPDCSPRPFARLPGARREAQAVQQLLVGPGALGPDRVVALVAPDDDSPGPDAREVVNALMSRAWRMVHISGHGEPPEDAGAEDWTDEAAAAPAGGGAAAPRHEARGVVLSNGAWLGPREIHSMRVVPELVFVNCCHLAGRSPGQLLADAADFDRARFASGVAESLIALGVRCVVAAGWAVEDEPASTFATTFYAALLRNERFADAVAQARAAAYAPGSNTWAAYQCYGDPNWRLKRDGSDPQRPTPGLGEEYAGICNAPALALALETIAVECEHQGRDKTLRRAKIRHLAARFGPAWGGMGAVAEAFAVAWAAAGEPDEAIAWYQRALAAGDASASMKAGEQLANLRARQAWARVQASTGRSGAQGRAAALQQARDELAQALALLDRLVALQPSLERHSLRGSACKRLAMVEREAGRADAELDALKRMHDEYAQALALGRAAGEPGAAGGEAAGGVDPDLFYPALNLLGAECTLAGRLGRAPRLPADIVRLARASLVVRTRDDPDFFSVLGHTELALYEALAAGQLAERAEALLQDLADLDRRMDGSPHWAAVQDQWRLVLDAGTARSTEPGHARQAGAAQRVLAQLARLARPGPA